MTHEELVALGDKCAADLVEYMQNLKGTKARQYCAQTGVATDQGAFQHTNNTNCHAGLEGINRELRYEGKKGEVVLAVSLTQDTFGGEHLETTEAGRAYADWLINHSVFSHVFISKDVDSVMKGGHAIVRADVPGNLMVMALIAHRRLWEYTNIVRNWHGLVERGMNPDLAYLVGHCFREDDTGDRLAPGMGWTCHVAPTPSKVGRKTIEYFLAGKYDQPLKDFNVGFQYYGMDKLYPCIENANLLNMCKQIPVDRVGGKTLNPFPVPKENRMYGSRDAVLNNAVAYFEKHFGEEVARAA